MHSRRHALLILTCAMLLSSGTAGAGYGDITWGPPKSGTGWSAYLIETDGAEILLEAGAWFSGPGLVVATVIPLNRSFVGYAEFDNNVMALSPYLSLDSEGPDVRVRPFAARAPAQPAAAGIWLNGDGWPIGAGQFYVVLYAVGNVSTWNIGSYVADGARILAVTEGTGGHFVLPRDFPGVATAGSALGPVGVHAGVDGRLAIDVEGTFVGGFGDYFGDEPGVRQLLVESGGVERECPCRFAPGDGKELPAGRATLTRTDAYMDRWTGEAPIFFGVDVQLPAAPPS